MKDKETRFARPTLLIRTLQPFIKNPSVLCNLLIKNRIDKNSRIRSVRTRVGMLTLANSQFNNQVKWEFVEPSNAASFDPHIGTLGR
jgi:hypothetical protein